MRYVYLALAFLATPAAAGQLRWFPVHMERGCMPLADAYAAYPELKGRKTPSEFVAALKNTASDVKSRPFVDIYESEPYKNEHPDGSNEVTAADRAVRKLLTNTNAVMITWNRGGNDDGLLFYTAELCKSLYGKLPS